MEYLGHELIELKKLKHGNISIYHMRFPLANSI